METKEYEGWSNYETWQCALWLDNDRDLYQAFMICASLIDVSRYRTDGEEELRELVHTHLYENMKIPNSLSGDIINAWMTEVNFLEIWERRYEELFLEGTVGETA